MLNILLERRLIPLFCATLKATSLVASPPNAPHNAPKTPTTLTTSLKRPIILVMFSLATGIYQSYFAPPKLSIVILGVDGSGKTALLERIKVTEINNDSNTDESTSSSSSTLFLPSMYTNGGAVVAGVHDDGCDETRAKQQKHHARHGGSSGRPARLPPPLPPQKALESRRLVEQMLKEGFFDDDDHGNATLLALGDVICPPPLVPILEKDGAVHRSSPADATKNQKIVPLTKVPPQQQTLSGTKPDQSTMPPLSSLTSGQDTMKPKPVAPVQHHKNTFIGLLRCPSPIKYSNSVIEDEYDYNEEELSGKDHLEEPSWNTEYLRDYYINYQEDEEFDIKHTRARGSSHSSSGGDGGTRGSQLKKMFPLDRIRPTLGQNLAMLDLRGCKCSLFDLSGAEKMRPLWERYYQDADAIIYVVNAAETSIAKLRQSRYAFEQMYANDVLHRRVRCGLPVLIFANQLDVAYKEYNDSLERANKTGEEQQQHQQQPDVGQRGISWNADEEDNFIGGMKGNAINDGTIVGDREGVSKRVVDLEGLATLFGFPRPTSNVLEGSSNGQHASDRGNIFFFGGSAKSGEGVRSAIEYLVTQAKSQHLARNPRR